MGIILLNASLSNLNAFKFKGTGQASNQYIVDLSNTDYREAQIYVQIDSYNTLVPLVCNKFMAENDNNSRYLVGGCGDASGGIMVKVKVKNGVYTLFQAEFHNNDIMSFALMHVYYI